MSDGGYSRIEKDFLGNERMVHYDGSGNMIGASDVIREPDGTIRIPNDSASKASELPEVRVIEPKQEPAAHIPTAAGNVMPNKNSGMPLNQTITYVIGTFVAAMLLTLGVMAFRASRGGGSAAQEFGTASAPIQRIERQTAQAPPPQDVPDNLPNDPKPRNDEPAQDAKPYDQTSPDQNAGDDNRPKVDSGNSEPTPPDPQKDNGKKGGGSNDPIDLRGDDDPKKGPPKGDPNDIH